MIHSINEMKTHLSVNEKKEKDLEKATQEFSKMFLRNALKNMFNEEGSQEASSFFGEGHSGEMWKFIFLNTVSDECAGKIGIEDSIRRSIAKNMNFDPKAEKGELVDANA